MGDIDDETKLVLWDTAGQERFQSITSSLYRGAHAVVFVYDVTNITSFNSLDQWMRDYRSFGNVKQSVALLLGNKTDLQRVVPREDAVAWAVGHNMCYEEVSAQNSDNVRAAFATVIRRLHTLPVVQKYKKQLRTESRSDRCY